MILAPKDNGRRADSVRFPGAEWSNHRLQPLVHPIFVAHSVARNWLRDTLLARLRPSSTTISSFRRERHQQIDTFPNITFIDRLDRRVGVAGGVGEEGEWV